MDWNVLDWNEPAIGFYKKLGADVLPDWRTCRVTGEALRALAGSSHTTSTMARRHDARSSGGWTLRIAPSRHRAIVIVNDDVSRRAHGVRIWSIGKTS